MAAPSEPNGGPLHPGEDGPALTEAQRKQIWNEIRANQALLRDAGILAGRQEQAEAATPLLGWPLAPVPSYSDPGYHGVSNYVDHDPTSGLEDFECGLGTYNGHHGTDYFLWPFWWNLMEAGSVQIVAAAAGTIVEKDDGRDDRSCSMSGQMWNAVYIEHDDGSIAWYGHMKKNSLTPKPVGERVERGELLGLVGSSGSSTGPHLHLELYDSADPPNLLDPYAGPCNPTTTASLWETQRPYIDSAINRIMTGNAPAEFPACPRYENEHAANYFLPGDTVYFTAFYRDQVQDQISTYTIYLPDGSVFETWTHASPAPFYTNSYWYWSIPLPASAPLGTWSFEAAYEGITHSHPFFVSEGIIGDSVEVGTINRNYPTAVSSDTVTVSATATEITCPSGNPGGFSFCDSPITIINDSVDLINAGIVFGFAPGVFPTTDPRFIGYRVSDLDWPSYPTHTIRKVTLDRSDITYGPEILDVSFDCHEVRMNFSDEGISIPSGGGQIRLELTTAPRSVLEGNSLTLRAFGPNRSTPLSAPLTSCVGANVEFPRIQAFQLASTPLANVSIDVDATSISWDFSEAGTSTFSAGDFNGYVFTDSMGMIPAFTGVAIDPAMNSLGLVASDVSFTEEEIAVNVAGRAFDPSTKLRITFLPEPSESMLLVAGVVGLLCLRQFRPPKRT